MPVEHVEPLYLRPVGLVVAVDGVAVEGVSQRLALAELRFEVDGGDVVVVVIGPAAMAAALVELAGDQGVGVAVVLDRVEDRYAVDRQGDRARKKFSLADMGCLATTGWSGIRQALSPVYV